MSMAHPYACCDHGVPPVTARQLKADVLFAAMDRSSSPPYTSTSCIRRTGKRAPNSLPNTFTTAPATFRLMTISPVRTAPSKPQYDIVRYRRSRIGTGQPGRQEEAIRARVAALMPEVVL